MEDLEEEIKLLLAGSVVPIKGKVDLKLKSAISDGPVQPITKRNVTYIVMAMVFDDRGRMVLIQEAKESCYGQWYPPAGRVEPGENLVDAVKREVLEEAGVEFEPQSVISVRVHHFYVIRIVYIGTCTGQLKTTEQKDSESLQASWFSMSEIKSRQVKLRCDDFFVPLELALKYQRLSPDKRHPAYNIGIHPHPHMIHRLLIIKESPSGSIEVLCNIKKGSLLTCAVNPPDNFSAPLAAFFMEVFNLHFKDGWPKLKLCGLLTLEHCGIPSREHDGICFTSVYVVPADQQQKMDNVINDNYSWIQINNTGVLEQLKLRTLSTEAQQLIAIL